MKWEVVKTRLQLQGELLKSSSSSSSPTATSRLGAQPHPHPHRPLQYPQKIYRGVGHAFVRIAKVEGWRGLQRGLVPAYFYQLTMNSVRFGGYETLKNGFTALLQRFPRDHPHPSLALRTTTTAATTTASTTTTTTTTSPTTTPTTTPSNTLPPTPPPALLVTILSGALAGSVGAALGSPFFLVKTRMQSYSQQTGMAVGVQYHYRSTLQALADIYAHGGIRACFTGAQAAMLR